MLQEEAETRLFRIELIPTFVQNGASLSRKEHIHGRLSTTLWSALQLLNLISAKIKSDTAMDEDLARRLALAIDEVMKLNDGRTAEPTETSSDWRW
jgi:hypothetical protein